MTSDAESAARAALTDQHPLRVESLERYVDILRTRGLDWGLLGPREGDRLWSRHVANSLALVDVIPVGLRLADVGSGAGLPGLPIAIVRPDLEVTLIEPLLRRVEFLNLAVAELGLQDRVHVLRGRAEEIRDSFDCVTCRAVAPLERLLKWTTPLFLPDGFLVALKGQSAEEEVLRTGKVLSSLDLTAQVLELGVAAGVESTRAIRVAARS